MSHNRQTPKVESKNLENDGLVAGMYDELGIGFVPDKAIEQDFEARKVSIGQAVKAMVLNGLGFINQRLYLFPKFFQDKTSQISTRKKFYTIAVSGKILFIKLPLKIKDSKSFSNY